MIQENVTALLKELEGGNCYHERVTLVAATKTRTPAEINEAIAAGITDIGENKVQEFTTKFDEVHGARRHYIGHLQLNKVKYLIGRTDLVESVDRDELASELAKRSVRAGIVTDILLEINIGCEESKSGYPLEEAFSAYERLSRNYARHCKAEEGNALFIHFSKQKIERAEEKCRPVPACFFLSL